MIFVELFSIDEDQRREIFFVDTGFISCLVFFCTDSYTGLNISLFDQGRNFTSRRNTNYLINNFLNPLIASRLRGSLAVA